MRDKGFNIAKNPKHGGYQRGLVSMVYKNFDKKNLCIGVNNKIKQNQELAEELHKPIIKIFFKNGFFLHLIFGVFFL